MAKLILVDYHDHGKAADILLANFLWEDDAQKRAEEFNRNPEHRGWVAEVVDDDYEIRGRNETTYIDDKGHPHLIELRRCEEKKRNCRYTYNPNRYQCKTCVDQLRDFIQDKDYDFIEIYGISPGIPNNKELWDKMTVDEIFEKSTLMGVAESKNGEFIPLDCPADADMKEVLYHEEFVNKEFGVSHGFCVVVPEF